MGDEKEMQQEEGLRVPGWVYPLLLIFLVAILLGVESALNWLLPASGR